MSKRFTETQKWEDPWFRKLRPEIKNLWQWILDHCDNAGVIDPDLDLASFQIGYGYPMDTLSELGERIIELPCQKFFVPKFIEFQYGELSAECKAHNPVFASLRKHGIERVSNGYSYPLRKGKGTGQRQEGEIPEDSAPPYPSKKKGTMDELKAYALEIGLAENDGEFLFSHFEETGWKRGKDPVKDWKATMRKWKAGGWLPSQKAPNSQKQKQQVFSGIQENIPL